LFEEIKNKAISLSIDPSVEHIDIALSKLGNDAGILGSHAFAIKHI
jgi:hypothetical protein